jgi:hypothetical protein
MKKIYIASPYTKGNASVNVKRQIDAANELIDAGFCPLTPLLLHFHNIVHPRPYDDWIKIDREWVIVCDAILRLPGESKGADNEVALAIRRGIPVFHSIEELKRLL